MFLKNKCLCFCVLSLVCLLSNAQIFPKKLDGRVQCDSIDVSNVHVMNITSMKSTITDAHGYFTIFVKINDTILFSAIQNKNAHLVINNEVYESKMVSVTLEEALFTLEEVEITPNKLSGNLYADIQSLKIEPAVTASTMGLPNANVKRLTVNERKLFFAMQEQGLHLLIDEISGHNKRLRMLVSRDNEESQIKTVQGFYSDSLYIQNLKIPSDRINDFMYFCAVDPIFNSTIEGFNKLKIWAFLEKKSIIYRKNYNLDQLVSD